MSSQLASPDLGQNETRVAPFPFHKIKGNGLGVVLLSDSPGVIEVPGARSTRVSIHIGPSIQVNCRRAGHSHRGLAVHGDIEIIPAHTPSVWEISEKDTFLAMSLSPELMNAVAEQLGLDSQRIEIRASSIFYRGQPQQRHITPRHCRRRRLKRLAFQEPVPRITRLARASIPDPPQG